MKSTNFGFHDNCAIGGVLLIGDRFSTQTKVSLLEVVGLLGHCKFIPADWVGGE